MATIQSAIRITDGMTPTFRAISKSMNIVINSFESLQRASDNPIDTAALQTAREELAKIDVTMDGVEQEIRQANAQQQKFTENVHKSDNAMGGLIKSAIGLVGAYAGVQTLGNIVNLSDTISQTNSKLNMILDTETDIKEMQDMIFLASENSRSSYLDTANVVARIGNNAKGVFDTNAELVKFAEILNQKYVIAGASSEEMSNSLIQLTQGLGSGVLRGEELNSVFESAPNIIQTIADYLDVDIGKIREMAAEGQITAEIVKNAMLSSAEDTQKQFDEMAITWGQRWTSMKNNAIRAFEPVLQKINDLANSPAIDAFMDTAVATMYVVADAIMWVVGLFESGANFIAENWGIISPILTGIAIALGVVAGAVVLYYTALGVLKGIEMASAVIGWIHNAMLVAKQGQLWNVVKATVSYQMAQWGVNTAVLVFVGIFLAVIAVVYIGVWALNTFAGTSISATGIVAGTFAALGQALFNIFAAIWNMIASVAEFFVNVWKHPMYSVKKLFVDIVGSILDLAISFTEGWDEAATGLANMFIEAVNIAIRAINWLIDAINLIPGIDLDHMDEFNKTTSITTTLKDTRQDLNDWLGEPPADYWEAPKMDMGSVGGAFDAGYAWGEGIENSIGDMFNGNGGIPGEVGESVKDALEGAGLGDPDGANKQTAANTAKMAQTMNASEEDLKYLRDLAEQETINRFTTAEIKVEMTNNNNINSDMDIDGIANKLTEKVQEQMISSAEGIHE